MKKIYHLTNNYNEHNEYTTDEEKIRKIYIDECLQCVDNNITENATKEDTENATKWLYESFDALYNHNTEYFIGKLNKEHNWNIEIIDKIEEKKEEHDFLKRLNFKQSYTNDTKDFIDFSSSNFEKNLFSYKELKQELIDRIKLDTIENVNDIDIVKANLDLLQKVIEDKANNKEEINLYGYNVENIETIINYLYDLYSLFYARQDYKYSDMLVELMNKINEIRN